MKTTPNEIPCPYCGSRTVLANAGEHGEDLVMHTLDCDSLHNIDDDGTLPAEQTSKGES